jgi:chromosome segregation ATPase
MWVHQTQEQRYQQLYHENIKLQDALVRESKSASVAVAPSQPVPAKKQK